MPADEVNNDQHFRYPPYPRYPHPRSPRDNDNVNDNDNDNDNDNTSGNTNNRRSFLYRHSDFFGNSPSRYPFPTPSQSQEQPPQQQQPSPYRQRLLEGPFISPRSFPHLHTFLIPPPPVSQDPPTPTNGSMPAAPRQAGGYVDLTSEPEPPSRRSRRSSSEPGPSAKRRKRDDGGSSPVTVDREEGKTERVVDIEEVDLSDKGASLRDTLEKQRADAIKAQAPQRPEDKPTTFNTFTCVICMETPTDITATACGHLFCHTCLMEALIAGEARTAPGEQRRSQCPVCRKHISRTKSADIIPLAIMKKGLATQPRKSAAGA